MKLASWGYCVSEFNSSGEPAAHPGDAFAFASVVPEVSFRLGVRHPVMKYPALERVFPWVMNQVCDNTSYCFDYIRDVCICLVFHRR